MSTLEATITRTVTVLVRTGQRKWPAVCTVPWKCPVCGGPRGEPRLTTFSIRHPGKARAESMTAHKWDNPCGHVDRHEDIAREAEAHRPRSVDVDVEQVEAMADRRHRAARRAARQSTPNDQES